MNMIQLQTGLQATNATLRTAVARGDSAGIAAVYTETGAVLTTNHDIIHGKPAIQKFWHYTLQGLGIRAAELETLELTQANDTVYEVGQYTLRGEWAIILEQGKYMVIWQQEGSEWKRHREIFSPSGPALI
ncbi:hypothetical protein BH10CHL1_BH10CHL1_14890 [soil metagenome]